MKFALTLALLALAAGFSAAQTAPSNQPPAAGTQSAPATQAAPGQQPGTQQAPAPGAKKPPEAKTQDELQAFNQAAASQTPDTAADGFAQKYPSSELRAMLYTRAMMTFQKQGNVDKLLEMARKVTAIDPNDPIANVFIATFLPDRVRESDLDRDEKYAEATKAANTALANADSISAPGAPPEQVEANKATIKSMAYAGLGTIALSKNDWTGAETNLKKAIDIGKESNPDAIMYLRYSVSLDRQKKYQEALQAANKAIELSPQGSGSYKLATDERQRLMQLMGTTPAAPAPKPATQQQTPSPQQQTPPPANQPNPSTPQDPRTPK
jgi:tetratricopeptide (TPR) repeat protein